MTLTTLNPPSSWVRTDPWGRPTDRGEDEEMPKGPVRDRAFAVLYPGWDLNPRYRRERATS